MISAPAGNLPLVFAREARERRNKTVISSTLISTFADTAVSYGGHTLSSHGLTLTEEVGSYADLEAAQPIPSSANPESQAMLSMPP